MKTKLLSSLFIILIFALPLSIYAFNIEDSSHKEVITKYHTDLDQMQKNIFTLSHNVYTTKITSTELNISFDESFYRIDNELDNIITSLNSYYATLPLKSPCRIDVLLLISGASYIKSSLLELSQLNETSSDFQAFLSLKNYFNYREEADEALTSAINHLS